MRPDAILLVTCGARLEPERLASWIDEVVRFLDEHPQAEWLVVGPDAAQGARFEQKHVRIRVLPQRTDLARWIALGDLYLNPPRFGGGASVAMAMAAGVPVVSMAGGDGGDKIGSFAVQNAADYRRRASQWVADGDRRAQAGIDMRAKFRDELDLSGPAANRSGG
ncbi:MAG: glycosyltransferase [Ramlibacter sp.]